MSAPVFGDIAAAKAYAPTIADEIDVIEINISNLEEELGDLDDERSAIARRQDDIEEELSDQRLKLSDLKSDKTHSDESAWISCRFTCMDCGFDVESYGIDSLDFRAECHHHETGHTVAILDAGDVYPFDQPIRTIGATR